MQSAPFRTRTGRFVSVFSIRGTVPFRWRSRHECQIRRTRLNRSCGVSKSACSCNTHPPAQCKKSSLTPGSRRRKDVFRRVAGRLHRKPDAETASGLQRTTHSSVSHSGSVRHTKRIRVADVLKKIVVACRRKISCRGYSAITVFLTCPSAFRVKSILCQFLGVGAVQPCICRPGCAVCLPWRSPQTSCCSKAQRLNSHSVARCGSPPQVHNIFEKSAEYIYTCRLDFTGGAIYNVNVIIIAYITY